MNRRAEWCKRVVVRRHLLSVWTEYRHRIGINLIYKAFRGSTGAWRFSVVVVVFSLFFSEIKATKRGSNFPISFHVVSISVLLKESNVAVRHHVSVCRTRTPTGHDVDQNKWPAWLSVVVHVTICLLSILYQRRKVVYHILAGPVSILFPFCDKINIFYPFLCI